MKVYQGVRNPHNYFLVCERKTGCPKNELELALEQTLESNSINLPEAGGKDVHVTLKKNDSVKFGEVLVEYTPPTSTWTTANEIRVQVNSQALRAAMQFGRYDAQYTPRGKVVILNGMQQID